MVSKQSGSTQPSSMVSSTKINPKWFKHVLSVKLNNENFLLWKQQVIRGHNLMQYLESSAKPPKYLSQEDDNTGNINPEFLEWDQ